MSGAESASRRSRAGAKCQGLNWGLGVGRSGIGTWEWENCNNAGPSGYIDENKDADILS